MSLQTMLCAASNSGIRRCSCCKETENDRYLNQIDINEYTTLFLCTDCLKDFVKKFTAFTPVDSSESLEFNSSAEPYQVGQTIKYVTESGKQYSAIVTGVLHKE